MTRATVSIVIPNLNGQAHLAKCIASIENLDFRRDDLECIVVDNNSEDGSLYFLNKYYPWVKSITLDENRGFAGAVNIGAEAAGGDILVFLNTDSWPHKDFLAEIVQPIESNDAVCTGAKILDSTGNRICFGGGGMNFHGIAYQRGEGEVDRQEFNNPQEELFACGAAMAVDRRVFLACGGFDTSFFAYFEDVDLGWRLWKLGYKVKYIPSSVVYHEQSATARAFDSARLRLLHVRNPLMMIYKNYDSGHFQKLFSVGMMLTIRRMSLISGIDERWFEINYGEMLADYLIPNPVWSRPDTSNAYISSISLADMVAMNEVLSRLPELDQARNALHSKFVVEDADIFHLFRDPLRYAENDSGYRVLHDQLVQNHGIDKLFGQTSKPTIPSRS